MISTSIDSCRVCQSNQLNPILDLGRQALANSLKDSLSAEVPEIPLAISRCSECGTIQLTEDVEPGIMFREYVWVTGTSKTAREYSEIFCTQVLSRTKNNKLQVLEVASNDGTFLRRFKEKGHKVLGVDPAANIAELANKKGIDTIAKFFSKNEAVAIKEKYGAADIVIARNVIPHVPNPHDVISGMAECMNNEGIGVIEFHWAEKILTEVHYDSIYHEHYFYHTIKSLEKILNMNGLHPYDVDRSPISGGSLVLYFSKEKREESERLRELKRHEKEIGLDNQGSWEKFAENTKKHAANFREMIKEEVDKGKIVIGYGASARSSTMLNYCSIDNKLLKVIADKSQLKHGKYTAGTNILITDPDDALKIKPDVIVILAWNFQEEIIEELKNKGYKGKLIIPLPIQAKIRRI